MVFPARSTDKSIVARRTEVSLFERSLPAGRMVRPGPFSVMEYGLVVERERFGGDSLFKKSGYVVKRQFIHRIVSYYKAKDTTKLSLEEAVAPTTILTRPSQDASLKSLELHKE